MWDIESYIMRVMLSYDIIWEDTQEDLIEITTEAIFSIQIAIIINIQVAIPTIKMTFIKVHNHPIHKAKTTENSRRHHHLPVLIFVGLAQHIFFNSIQSAVISVHTPFLLMSSLTQSIHLFICLPPTYIHPYSLSIISTLLFANLANAWWKKT